MKKNIEDVLDDIVVFKRRFAVLKTNLELAENSSPPDTPFIEKFGYFLTENAHLVIQLEEELKSTKEFYIETMLLYGENKN